MMKSKKDGDEREDRPTRLGQIFFHTNVQKTLSKTYGMRTVQVWCIGLPRGPTTLLKKRKMRFVRVRRAVFNCGNRALDVSIGTVRWKRGPHTVFSRYPSVPSDRAERNSNRAARRKLERDVDNRYLYVYRRRRALCIQNKEANGYCGRVRGRTCQWRNLRDAARVRRSPLLPPRARLRELSAHATGTPAHRAWRNDRTGGRVIRRCVLNPTFFYCGRPGSCTRDRTKAKQRQRRALAWPECTMYTYKVGNFVTDERIIRKSFGQTLRDWLKLRAAELRHFNQTRVNRFGDAK